MNKKQYKELGRKGSNEYWAPIRTRKMEVIQKLYLRYGKTTVDWMTKGWGIEKLEELLNKNKHD